jgi:hypothetical protein
LGEWCSDEVGDVDRGGDIGRIGEIGDRFRIALASIISDPSEARVRAASESRIWRSEGGEKRGASKSEGMESKRGGKGRTYNLVDYYCMDGNDIDGSELRKFG